LVVDLGADRSLLHGMFLDNLAVEDINGENLNPTRNDDL
jgi:hypothetical protein